MKYLVVFVLFLVSCKKSGTSKTEERQNVKVGDTLHNTPAKKDAAAYGALIPYDEKDDPEPHHSRSIQDTVTPNGWKITYLVKNDSTQHKDLYIQWSKGGVKRTYRGSILLDLQSYFTPVFKTDTKDYIYMKCEVRGGDALLILPKDATTPERNFSYVVGYSAEFAQVAYIPESSYSLEEMTIEACDIKSGKIQSVQFRKPCTVTPEGDCLLKAEFDGKHVKIFSDSDGNDAVSEIKTITF